MNRLVRCELNEVTVEKVGQTQVTKKVSERQTDI